MRFVSCKPALLQISANSRKSDLHCEIKLWLAMKAKNINLALQSFSISKPMCVGCYMWFVKAVDEAERPHFLAGCFGHFEKMFTVPENTLKAIYGAVQSIQKRPAMFTRPGRCCNMHCDPLISDVSTE